VPRDTRIDYILPEHLPLKTKLPCPRCGSFSETRLSVPHEERHEYEHGHYTELAKSCLAVCQGCNGAYLAVFVWDDFDQERFEDPRGPGTQLGWQMSFYTFPKSSHITSESLRKSKDLDDHLGHLIDEASKCLSHELYASCAMAIRAYIDRLTLVMGFNGHPLAPRVERLKTDGYVPPQLHDLLDKIVNAGHAAIHRSWVPSKEDAQSMMVALEVITSMVQLTKLDPSALSNIPPKNP